jgi:signal transduction histidine kinase
MRIRRILMVDDEADITVTLKMALEDSSFFEVNTFNDPVVQAYRNQMQGQNKVGSAIEILFVPNEDVILVEADKGRLIQVISNLLDNSFKFTKSTSEGKGKITIISEKKDNKVTVGVMDTGTGIDPEIFPKLFSRFASKSFSGTGLGLFISKSIIEEHGGKIWAQNNPNGRGATFSFNIASSN